MSHITQEELEHLAKLSKLKLSDEQKTSLLWDVDNILGMISQLEEVDVSDVETNGFPHTDVVATPRKWVVECSDNFLQNVEHPIVANAIVVKSAIK